MFKKTLIAVAALAALTAAVQPAGATALANGPMYNGFTVNGFVLNGTAAGSVAVTVQGVTLPGGVTVSAR